VIRRIVALTVCTLAAVGIVGVGTAQAQYNETDCRFLVTPLEPAPGQEVTINGQGFPANQPVNFNLGQFTIASATTDAGGGVYATGVIPNVEDGTYDITVDCGGVASNESITVNSGANSSGNNASGSNAGSTGSTTGSLAGTGADPLPFVKAALMLLAVGGLIVLATKRRQPART